MAHTATYSNFLNVYMSNRPDSMLSLDGIDVRRALIER